MYKYSLLQEDKTSMFPFRVHCKGLAGNGLCLERRLQMVAKMPMPNSH